MSKITNVVIVKTDTGRNVSCLLKVTEDRFGIEDCIVANVRVALTIVVDYLYDYEPDVTGQTFMMDGDYITAAELADLTPAFRKCELDEVINKLTCWEWL